MNHRQQLEAKIHTVDSLPKLLATWEQGKERVVFTNGCFDLIHRGHVDYLSRAADKGTKLIIGVNTDSSVSRLKGPHRPIQDEYTRLMILAAFSFVNVVVLFDEPTPYELIALVQPNVLVKGSDYKPEDIVGYDIVKVKGGEVSTIDFLDGFSTSGIEKKIRETHT